MKLSLRDFTLRQLEDLAASLGEKTYRARQLAQWLYQRGASSFEEITDLPQAFVGKLSEAYWINALALVSKTISEEDRSIKYLFKTQDEHFVESVLIFQGKRRTVCLSTQIGCKMGCRFCASGKKGLSRHLTCGEILDQVAGVRKDRALLPTNLVYMGMGEPLDNYDAVLKSIRIANAPWGFGIGQRRITLSTVGVVPGIRRLGSEGLNQIKLCVSLHSPDNEVRTKLIPSSRRYKLPEIIQVLKEVRPKFKREITMEYILLEGLTDRESDIKGLAEIGRSLRAKVNLIPYNRIDGVEFKRPSSERIRSFQRGLEALGVRTTVRFSAGQDIAAACGQLRLFEEQKSETTVFS